MRAFFLKKEDKLFQLFLIYASMGKTHFSGVFRMKNLHTHKSELAEAQNVKLAYL